MNKDEKRELRRKRLMDNKAYQTMNGLTRYMDRYYLDALIGIIPGWGDAIALLCVVPFVYFSSRVIKSIPLTLAVLNNALRDVLMGMIPFFVGDVIDFPYDMGTRQLWQLPVFFGGIHLLNHLLMHMRPGGLPLSQGAVPSSVNGATSSSAYRWCSTSPTSGTRKTSPYKT